MNLKIRRCALLAALACTLSFGAHAQSSMTDEQVMEFVINENAKGTSQQQIVTKLMQRGVDIQQIRRIREKYEKEHKGDVLGAKDLTGKNAIESRLRQNNGDKKDDKLENAENYRRRVIQEKEEEAIFLHNSQQQLYQKNIPKQEVSK